MNSSHRLRAPLGAAVAGAALVSLIALTGIGSAASAPPVNTGQPTISGDARVGSTLTASEGQWSGSPTSFAYQWVRCPATGGRPDGSDCAVIPGATTQVYTVGTGDIGSRLRVRVTAANSAGSATAASNATEIVPQPTAPPPATGCPAGTGAVRADQLRSPARLSISGQRIGPRVVTRSTRLVTVQFRVTACGGRPVQGALVYVTFAPYNQFSVPTEQATNADGWATLTMRRLRGYPASRNQQLLVMFVRGRKANENPLGGISTRRLVSFPVDLRR